MPAHHLSFRARFARDVQSWKNQRGGLVVTWLRATMKVASALASIGACRLPGRGPSDEGCYYLKIMKFRLRTEVICAKAAWSVCSTHLPLKLI